WCIWPLFRLNAQVCTLQQLKVTNAETGWSPQKLLTLAAREVPRCLKLNQADMVIATLSTYKSKTADGRFRDPFADPVIERIPSSLKIERPNDPRSLTPRRDMQFPSALLSTPLDATGAI